MKIIASTADYFKSSSRPAGTTDVQVVKTGSTSNPVVEFHWSDAENPHLFRIQQSELLKITAALEAGLL